VWRRWAVSLLLLVGLLTGCHDGGKHPSASPTTGSGGPSSTTASTAPGPPSTLVDAWFTGDQDGWGLSSEACPRPGAESARCAVVSRTTDGGGSWTRLARLDASTAVGVTTDSVSAVHFADSQHGWLFDRSLYATFNGGKRWQPVDLGTPVTAFGSAGNQAAALIGSCSGAGTCAGPMRLFEGAIATGRWRFVALGFDLPATDAGDVVASRSGLYALVGASAAEAMLLGRTSNGRWERRAVPCPRALLAAIEGEDGLVAACRPELAGGPVELQTSSDGGRSWAVVWEHSFPSPVVSLAVTGDAAVVGLENGDVVRSGDNGLHFMPVLHTGANPELRFSDAQHGVATAGPEGARRLFRTGDGGASWQPLAGPS
jgi:photosystem II stability/assembly factor-like uncharacterized protein